MLSCMQCTILQFSHSPPPSAPRVHSRWNSTLHRLPFATLAHSFCCSCSPRAMLLGPSSGAGHASSYPASSSYAAGPAGSASSATMLTASAAPSFPARVGEPLQAQRKRIQDLVASGQTGGDRRLGCCPLDMDAHSRCAPVAHCSRRSRFRTPRARGRAGQRCSSSS
jgi:hypothetical protein